MNLENLFICPQCRHDLKKSEEGYLCNFCKAEYTISDGVPVFLSDPEAKKRSEFWDKGWYKRVRAGDHKIYIDSNPEELKVKVQEDIRFCQREKKAIAIDTMPIDDKYVLNIGCGVGEAPIFTLLGADNYIGLDFSYNAAKVSRENIIKLGGKGITAQANAESLPLRDKCIDIIFSNGVLHHTPETQKTFQELFRVLKPGGKAIIGLYITFSPQFINDRIIGMIKALYKKNRRYWYNSGEGAWKTEDCANPWTKTYTKRELKKIISTLNPDKLNFRKFGFNWATAIPSFGKYNLGTYIDKTSIGKYSAKLLDSKLGGMWIITFFKK